MMIKQARNNKCLCGSGLKYKKCCLIKSNDLRQMSKCDVCDGYLAKDGIRIRCLTCEDLEYYAPFFKKEDPGKISLISRLEFKRKYGNDTYRLKKIMKDKDCVFGSNVIYTKCVLCDKKTKFSISLFEKRKVVCKDCDIEVLYCSKCTKKLKVVTRNDTTNKLKVNTKNEYGTKDIIPCDECFNFDKDTKENSVVLKRSDLVDPHLNSNSEIVESIIIGD